MQLPKQRVRRYRPSATSASGCSVHLVVDSFEDDAGCVAARGNVISPQKRKEILLVNRDKRSFQSRAEVEGQRSSRPEKSVDTTLQQDEEGQGSVWEIVTPARLNLWIKCPLAFRFEYLDQVPTAVPTSMLLGRLVHQSLADFYRSMKEGEVPSWDDLVDYLEVAWESLCSDGGDGYCVPEKQDDLFDQACALLRVYLHQRPSDAEQPLAVGSSFTGPLTDVRTGEDLGIRLSGAVDLVLEADDGPLILDLKTASRGGAINEPLHEFTLTCCAYLSRVSLERTESGLEIRKLIKTKVPRLECHTWAAREERHFQRLFSVVRAYLDNLDSGQYIMRPNFGCPSCQYRSYCDGWCG